MIERDKLSVHPAARTEVDWMIRRRYGGLTWELARLWVRDEETRNTEWFISRAVKIVKRERRDVRFLVSYADPSA